MYIESLFAIFEMLLLESVQGLWHSCGNRVVITSVAVALVEGAWRVWWGEESGQLGTRDAEHLLAAGTLGNTRDHVIVRIRRVRVLACARARVCACSRVRTPHTVATLSVRRQVREAGAVRGVAVDWVAARLYWTAATAGAAGLGGGAVRVAALDGRRRVTLYKREGAEPDDIVIHNQTGYVYDIILQLKLFYL